MEAKKVIQAYCKLQEVSDFSEEDPEEVRAHLMFYAKNQMGEFSSHKELAVNKYMWKVLSDMSTVELATSYAQFILLKKVPNINYLVSKAAKGYDAFMAKQGKH